MSRSLINKIGGPSAALWLLNGSRLHEDDLAFFAQWLSASEAHRYACFTRRERQRQFLLGRILIRFAVSSFTAVPPDLVGVIERRGNAPQLVLPDSPCLRPNFSLSHSRDWVACAVSAGAVLGLDIEVNDPSRDIIGLSAVAFHPTEYLWLLRQPDAARLPAFYQLWSTKEALFKLATSVGREPASSPLVGADSTLASRGCGWHRYTLPHSGVTIVICSNRSLSALRKVELTGLTRADWSAADRGGYNRSLPTQ